MITVDGYYFNGQSPVRTPASMDLAGPEVVLHTATKSERYSASRVYVSPRIGSADRFINFPEGGQFACQDGFYLDSLPQESPSEGPVAWLEERWGVAVACVAVIVGALLLLYFIALPMAAERIAGAIPIETEASLGKYVLQSLDEIKWFRPTGLDAGKQEIITADFDRLRAGLPLGGYLHLEFRSSRVLGPNAVALPGGTIVITDEMIKAAQEKDEIMAVLAHEIAHEELRHMLRRVLQDSIVGIMAVSVTSDAASLSLAVTGLPTLLVETKYSREFETAADEYSFSLMKQKGYSPLAFASIMERLAKTKTRPGHFSYLSTHPLTEDRIARARAAAVQ